MLVDSRDIPLGKSLELDSVDDRGNVRVWVVPDPGSLDPYSESYRVTIDAHHIGLFPKIQAEAIRRAADQGRPDVVSVCMLQDCQLQFRNYHKKPGCLRFDECPILKGR